MSTNRDVSNQPVLEMRSIVKRFPGVLALDKVDFTLMPGEVHGLVGANGAGKSTLMKVLGGVYGDYRGQILIGQNACEMRSPREAQEHGVSVIHQEFSLVSTLTVAENIVLGMEPRRGTGMLGKAFLDWPRLRQQAASLLDELGFDKVDPDSRVADLSVAEQQLVQIAKAIAADARILVMDEPTARLSKAERDELFRIIDRLKHAGTSIVYISHFLEEVFQVADRVTVMRDGKVVAVHQVEDLDRRELVRLMLGRDIQSGDKVRVPSAADKAGMGEAVLSVDGLSRNGKFEGISFKLHRGEVLGIAGLVGSGRTDLARAIFGADGAVDSGNIVLKGKTYHPKTPRKAVRSGIALLPEDRKQQGLVLVRPVSDNTMLAVAHKLVRGLFLDHRARHREVHSMIKRLSIKCASQDVSVGTLSGGNQQKVVLAKWLAASPDILILDQPTAGVDVGTKEEIYVFLRRLAAAGSALIMISDDPEELSRVCDRILIMRRGRIVQELGGDAASGDVLTAVTGDY